MCPVSGVRLMEESTLYTEPALYDQIFPRARDSQYMGNEVRRKRMIDSEAFYLDEARCSVGPVLELACGSGRLTIPIAQGGTDIVGVDLIISVFEATILFVSNRDSLLADRAEIRAELVRIREIPRHAPSGPGESQKRVCPDRLPARRHAEL